MKEEDRKRERERKRRKRRSCSSCLASFYQSQLLPASDPHGGVGQSRSLNQRLLNVAQSPPRWYFQLSQAGGAAEASACLQQAVLTCSERRSVWLSDDLEETGGGGVGEGVGWVQ